MVHIVNVADLVNPKSGKTYRQENAERVHKFNVGQLVEIDDGDRVGIRLYVIEQTRDCDQTPMYCLHYMTPEQYQELQSNMSMVRMVWPDGLAIRYKVDCLRGISEDSLKSVNQERG